MAVLVGLMEERSVRVVSEVFWGFCALSIGDISQVRLHSLELFAMIVVKVFAHGAMGHRIDPSWGGPIELFLVPASDPRLV